MNTSLVVRKEMLTAISGSRISSKKENVVHVESAFVGLGIKNFLPHEHVGNGDAHAIAM